MARTPQKDYEQDMLDPEFAKAYQREALKDDLEFAVARARRKFGLLRTLWLIVKQIMRR